MTEKQFLYEYEDERFLFLHSYNDNVKYEYLEGDVTVWLNGTPKKDKLLENKMDIARLIDSLDDIWIIKLSQEKVLWELMWNFSGTKEDYRKRYAKCLDLNEKIFKIGRDRLEEIQVELEILRMMDDLINQW